jgi:hypothetical protein
MLYKALAPSLLALALLCSPAGAQSSNAPPVVDTFTVYWTPNSQLPGSWFLHTVVRVHDPDSERVFARVLVLDKMGRLMTEFLLGTEPDEGEHTIENEGLLGLSPEALGHLEIVAYDSDGNTLDPISITAPELPTSASPSLRAAKLNHSRDAVIVSGKRMRRIVGVELNGTTVPASALSIRVDGKKVHIAAADGALPLGDGFNSLRVVTEGGRSNEMLIRK